MYAFSQPIEGKATSACYARKAQSNLVMMTSCKLLGEKVHLWWPILARIPRCPTEKGGARGWFKSGKCCDLVFLIEGLLRPGSFSLFGGIKRGIPRFSYPNLSFGVYFVGHLGFRAIIILIAQVVTVLIPLIERSFPHVLDRPSSRLLTFRYDMARPTT